MIIEEQHFLCVNKSNYHHGTSPIGKSLIHCQKPGGVVQPLMTTKLACVSVQKDPILSWAVHPDSKNTPG